MNNDKKRSAGLQSTMMADLWFTINDAVADFRPLMVFLQTNIE
jgi:hypothetical protein